jgi:hypothetical protein
MFNVPKLDPNIVVYTNTPKQVAEVHATPAITDTTKHQKNEQERRKQQDRRRLKNKQRSTMDQRLPNDRRGPSFSEVV